MQCDFIFKTWGYDLLGKDLALSGNKTHTSEANTLKSQFDGNKITYW